MTRLVVVSAGLSQPSATRLLADRLTDAVSDRLRALDDEPEVRVLELRELGTDVMSAMLTGGMPSARLAEASAALASADAVIAVTPVFTASYSGLFKSFFDVLDPGVLRGTPVLIGATVGTERHSLVLDHALRPMFTYLQAVVVPDRGLRIDRRLRWEGRRRGRRPVPAHRPCRRRADRSAAHSRPTPPGSESESPRPRQTDALTQAEADEDDGSFAPFEQLLGHST